MIENLDTDMIIQSMTEEEVFALVRSLERHHDVRITMITKNDVNDVYRMALASEGIDRRDLTDEEWEKFSRSWFWQKGHLDIMWEGVQEAVAWDLREEKIIPETVII